MDISVVIPTKNAGPHFRQVLQKVFAQKIDLQYEVICVDSGSSDETIAIIKEFPTRFYAISPEEFGHGKTRNWGASEGSGEFIVFLTQDALPADEHWLNNLVSAVKQDDAIAGAFGRHIAYRGSNPFDKRDLDAHFRNFGEGTVVFAIDDAARYESDCAYRNFLAFFSDNNSCLRRTVWEKIPYRDVNFAEDQIWAREILEAGYKKAYVESATVFHSHDYPLNTYFKRYLDEFLALYRIQGVVIAKNLWRVLAQTAAQFLRDIAYIQKQQFPLREKLHWLRYSLQRNLYRNAAGYLACRFDRLPKGIQNWLNKHASQQTEQISA